MDSFTQKVLELLDILIENDKVDMELDDRVRGELLELYKNKGNIILEDCEKH